MKRRKGPSSAKKEKPLNSTNRRDNGALGFRVLSCFAHIVAFRMIFAKVFVERGFDRCFGVMPTGLPKRHIRVQPAAVATPERTGAVSFTLE
jgi:hypothetical protein